MSSNSRRALNKLMDPRRALALAEEVDLFARVPFEPGLTLDTTAVTPDAVARRIVEYCSRTPG